MSIDIDESHTKRAAFDIAQRAETGLIRRVDQWPDPFVESSLSMLDNSLNMG